MGVRAPLGDFNLTDFDGDGYVDIVTRLGRPGMAGQSHAPGIYLHKNRNSETDLVKTITNGCGPPNQV